MKKKNPENKMQVSWFRPELTLASITQFK